MLASEGGRSRVSVACRNRVVDVDEDARVSVLVSTWESDKVLGHRAATTRDLKLCTRQIELGAALALGNVQGNVFVAHQVIARSNALGDGDVVVGSTCEFVRI
jgi:hypothetical protein